MIINNCNFPDNLLYDPDNFVWIDTSNTDYIKIGIIPIFSSISGKIKTIKLKKGDFFIDKGKSLGSIESPKYFGIVRSPFSGKIKEINLSVLSKPKQVNDSPYELGWLVKLVPSNLEEDLNDLKSIDECHVQFKTLIDEFHVRCFKAYPDYEYQNFFPIMKHDIIDFYILQHLTLFVNSMDKPISEVILILMNHMKGLRLL